MAVDERRQYPRLKAPVFYRPTGLALLRALRRAKERAIDISLGGVRIYSDQKFAKGELLTLELMTVDAPISTFTAEVMWIEELPAGSPALFDVGLRFRSVDPTQAQALERMLGKSE